MASSYFWKVLKVTFHIMKDVLMLLPVALSMTTDKYYFLLSTKTLWILYDF